MRRDVFLALAGEPQKELSHLRLGELLLAGAKRERPGLAKIYELATKLSQSGRKRGLFLLMAATHGLHDQGADYLIAADSRRDYLSKTGIEVKDLFDMAARADSLRRLVVIDACRERLSRGTKSIVDVAMARSFAGAIARATGLTVLAGSTAGGYSYDDLKNQNGVFTGALVEGLLGAAQADDRGFITVATLATFAQDRVIGWVRRNRREHLALSRGIEKRFDGAAEQIPLAIDPLRSGAIEDYQRRRTQALVRLRENIGDILDGRSYDFIKAFLPTSGLPTPGAEELLAELEVLDGSKRAQRSLQRMIREIQSSRAAAGKSSPRRLAMGLTSAFALVVAVWFGVFQSEEEKPKTKVRAAAPLAQEFSGNEADEPESLNRSSAAASAGDTQVLKAQESDNQKHLTDRVEESSSKKTEVSSPPLSPAFRARTATFEPVAGDKPKPGALAFDSFGVNYRWIPGGTYTIGSPDQDQERCPDEVRRRPDVDRAPTGEAKSRKCMGPA